MNAINKFGASALYYAARDKVEVVKILLTAGAKVSYLFLLHIYIYIFIYMISTQTQIVLFESFN